MSHDQNHAAREKPDSAMTDHPHPPYWKRAHLDWRVWVALFFIFAAMLIYVVTVDLSLVPRASRPHTLTRTP
jgi:hypothetical protein